MNFTRKKKPKTSKERLHAKKKKNFILAELKDYFILVENLNYNKFENIFIRNVFNKSD